LPVPRLGIAVPGRLGNAVKRNRVKRRVREASRAAAMPAGADIVIVARAAAAGATFERLQESVRGLFNRAAGSFQ